MSNQSNVPNKNSETSQSLCIDCDSSSSNFSLSKTRKTQRRTNKKKITKIVHTYCFLRVGKDGRHEHFYLQQVAESGLKDTRSVKNLAMRQLDEHSSRIMENAKESTDFAEKEPSETMMRIEQDLVLPAFQSFQPAQFYYMF